MTNDQALKLLLGICNLHGLKKLRHLSEHIDVPHEIKTGVVKNVPCHNLVTTIRGTEKPEKKILITAHHDVVNRRSQNCLDNNGSVMNLIRLMNEVKFPKCTIIMAITDHEETSHSRLHLNGCFQLMFEHTIDQHLDLELTSSGDIPAISTYKDFDLIEDVISIKQPCNSAMLCSRHAVAPRGSACITLLDSESLEEYEAMGFCHRWTNCHQVSDSIEKWYNPEDCDNFVEFLKDKIINYDCLMSFKHKTSI